MAHKLRHAMTERPEFSLEGLVEVDESYYGGRGKPESRGRSLANPNKSLLVMAVEKRPVGPGKGIKERFDNSEETAWGDGEYGTQFSDTRNWATYFTVDLSTLPL